MNATTDRLLDTATRREDAGLNIAAMDLRTRAAVVGYMESQAKKFEQGGQADEATALRATATSVAAGLYHAAGQRGIASAVTAIILQVAAETGASFDEVVGPTRGCESAVRARQAAMWIAKKRLGWSNEVLAQDSHRDPSTSSHGVDRAEDLRSNDDDFRALTDRLRAEEIRCEHCLTPLTH